MDEFEPVGSSAQAADAVFAVETDEAVPAVVLAEASEKASDNPWPAPALESTAPPDHASSSPSALASATAAPPSPPVNDGAPESPPSSKVAAQHAPQPAIIDKLQDPVFLREKAHKYQSAALRLRSLLRAARAATSERDARIAALGPFAASALDASLLAPARKGAFAVVARVAANTASPVDDSPVASLRPPVRNAWLCIQVSLDLNSRAFARNAVLQRIWR